MVKTKKELQMSIHNRFDFEVVDARTGEVKQRAQAFNVLCVGYFNHIFGNVSSILYGSGSGTPATSDTALFHYEGTASDAATYSPYDITDRSRESEGIWVRRIKRTIPNTDAVGVNITEVGFGTTTAGWLLTHAMLQDMNGNPISIHKTDTDIINIICSLYLHYSGQNSDITVYNEYTWDYRSVNGSLVSLALYGGVHSSGVNVNIGKGNILTSLNVGRQFAGVKNGDSKPSTTNYVYDASTHILTITYPQIPVSTGNIYGARQIGIGAMTTENSSAGYLHASILIQAGGTTFPTAHITDESVGIGDGSTTRFATKFNSPYNATVKINGVTVSSGVTVNKYPVYVGANAGSGKWELTPVTHLYQEHFRWVYVDKPNIPSSPDAYNKPSASEVLTNLPFSDWDSMLEDLCPDLGVIRINQSNPQGSNDGINWTNIAANTDLATPVHYKYYRSSNTGSGNAGGSMFRPAFDGNNIIFDNPPANGDVITIDYDTDTIPKDSDHVLDVTLNVVFGEYQGE